MNDDTSAELLAKSLNGHTDALNRLIDEYRPYLLNIARDKIDSAIQQRLDASDVVQQTCLEVTRDFGNFRGTEERQFMAWMKQILINNVANARRDHVFTKMRTTDKERPLDDGSQRSPAPAAAKQSTPSARAIREEASADLRRRVNQLPDDQAEAVRLRHLEGWSLKQMAEHFGRSEVAVAGLLKRGMQTLREQAE